MSRNKSQLVDFTIYADIETRDKVINAMPTFTPVNGAESTEDGETIAVVAWLADLDEMDRTTVVNLAGRVAASFYEPEDEGFMGAYPEAVNPQY